MSEESFNQIRLFNKLIAEKISRIKELYKEKNIPVDICEKILGSEQKIIAAMYLAEFPGLILDDAMIDSMGTPSIDKNLSSGLDHDSKTVVLTNMDKVIANMRKDHRYGSEPSLSHRMVKDAKTYESFMLLSGGCALDHYLTLLPHELRHLFGVSGNSDFPEQSGFAEGKTEKDTRFVMKKYGYEFYMDRNYSPEVIFINYLESVLGKETVDRLGSFKIIKYKELSEEYGKEMVQDYIRVNDTNSLKKATFLKLKKDGIVVLKENKHYITEITSKLGNIENIENYLEEELLRMVLDEDSNDLIINYAKIAINEAVGRQRAKQAVIDKYGQDRYYALGERMAAIEEKRIQFAEKVFIDSKRLTPEQIDIIRKYVAFFNSAHKAIEKGEAEDSEILKMYYDQDTYKDLEVIQESKKEIEEEPTEESLRRIRDNQKESIEVLDRIIKEREKELLIIPDSSIRRE